MRFIVSACLLGCPCKHDGGTNSDSGVKKFLTGKEYVAFCPEEAGGLPTPREPSEIQGGRVRSKSGRDVSPQFRRGAVAALKAAEEFGARGAILKARSPSCGIRAVYDGSFTGRTRVGRGMTAAALAEAGLLLFSEEALPEEGLLVDCEEIERKIVAWLREKVEGAGAKGCVLGLSGGIDSAVVAALAHRAFPETTLAAILPVESSPEDVEDAWLVARSLGLETVEINLDGAYRALLAALGAGDRAEDLAAANIKPRLRMAAWYYLAARHGYLVVGTGNKSEIVTGFFTKHGDAGVDLEPIGSLIKTQVWELARHLGLPEKIIAKRPSAGLWPGQDDEDELGFSYRQLDEYILSGTTDQEAVAKIERAIRRSRHKQEMPPVCPL